MDKGIGKSYGIRNNTSARTILVLDQEGYGKVLLNNTSARPRRLCYTIVGAGFEGIILWKASYCIIIRDTIDQTKLQRL